MKITALCAALVTVTIGTAAVAEPANYLESVLTSPLSGIYTQPDDETNFIVIAEIGPQGVFQWSNGHSGGISAYAPGATDGCINLLVSGELASLCPIDQQVSGVKIASGVVYMRE